MKEIFLFLEKLQTPALMLSGAFIFILVYLLIRSEKSRDAFTVSFVAELNEFNKLQTKTVTLLDLLCTKMIGGR